MADVFLRANENFVRDRVQQVEQLLLLLPRVHLAQEHLCLDLLLDVEDDLEDAVDINSYWNVSYDVEIRVGLIRLVHLKDICHKIKHASPNEVEEEV